MSHASAPVPQGNYVPAKRFGNLVCVSGMTPRENGVLKQVGKIVEGEPLQSGALERRHADGQH